MQVAVMLKVKKRPSITLYLVNDRFFDSSCIPRQPPVHLHARDRKYKDSEIVCRALLE